MQEPEPMRRPPEAGAAQESPAQPGAEAQGRDTMPSPEEIIRTLELQAQEHYDGNLIMPQLLNRYGGLLASHQRAEFDAERICATD